MSADLEEAYAAYERRRRSYKLRSFTRPKPAPKPQPRDPEDDEAPAPYEAPALAHSPFDRATQLYLAERWRKPVDVFGARVKVEQPPPQRRVLEALKGGPKRARQLCVRLGAGRAAVIAAIGALWLQGLVVEDREGFFTLRQTPIAQTLGKLGRDA